MCGDGLDERKAYTCLQTEFLSYRRASPAEAHVGIVGAMACPRPASGADSLPSHRLRKHLPVPQAEFPSYGRASPAEARVGIVGESCLGAGIMACPRPASGADSAFSHC